MATGGNQSELRLAFGVHRAPIDAPSKILRQIETEAQATEWLAVIAMETREAQHA